MNVSPRRTVCSLLVLLLAVGAGHAADWQPAKGPLLTRWAKDVSPDKVHPEYPRPQMTRPDWLNLNGLWDYAVTPKDSAQPDKPAGKILVPFPIESALSGVMQRVDEKSVVWYRRTFEIPKAWTGRSVVLHFGAVNWDATVSVNGKKVGTHRGGYDGFRFDITDALKKDGPQELVVAVWNPVDAGTQPRGKQVRKPGGIFYTPSTGIWQTVWIEPVNSHGWIEGLTIKTDLDRDEVTVAVNLSQTLGNSAFHVEVFDGDKVIAEANGLDYSFTIKVPDAKRWTPETPHLYGLRVSVSGMKRESGSDRVSSYFAFRKIALGKDAKGVTRILLNGKPYFQVGLLDQGFWPDGLYTAPTDEALKYDLEMTKKLGFNLARKHVKVEPERWYYWCDKLGVLVWQDMPSGDKSAPWNGPSGKPGIEMKRTPESAAQHERELKAMIDGRRNHPCIVTWVPFNEGWGQYDTVRIAKWVKEYDPTRLVNAASGGNDFPCGDLFDWHQYPGPFSPKPEPTRAAVLGEFGGLGLPLEGHLWTKDRNWGYQGAHDQADLTRKYEKLLVAVGKLKDDPGLSAAIYTQTTDVETEINGLMTYDRVLKPDAERLAAINRGDTSRLPRSITLVPTARQKPATWRYTFDKPADAWSKNEFNDSTWKEGASGFGSKGTPGAVIGTEWTTPDVWIRREFELPDEKLVNPQLLLHHDDDVEVYINGVLAAKLSKWTTDYEEVPLSQEALATLKPGKNRFAVHCHQIQGGQYIDVGLIDLR